MCDRFRLMEAVTAKVSYWHINRPKPATHLRQLLSTGAQDPTPDQYIMLCRAGSEGLFRPECGGGDPCQIQAEHSRLCHRAEAFFLNS